MGHAVVHHGHLVTVLSEASLCMAGWLSSADLLPQLDLTMVGAEGLEVICKYQRVVNAPNALKRFCQGGKYFCVMVDC